MPYLKITVIYYKVCTSGNIDWPEHVKVNDFEKPHQFMPQHSSWNVSNPFSNVFLR